MNQIEESAKSGWTSQHFEWLSPSEKNYIRLLGYYIEPIHGAYKFVVSWDKTNDKPIADLTPMHRDTTSMSMSPIGEAIKKVQDSLRNLNNNH